MSRAYLPLSSSDRRSNQYPHPIHLLPPFSETGQAGRQAGRQAGKQASSTLPGGIDVTDLDPDLIAFANHGVDLAQSICKPRCPHQQIPISEASATSTRSTPGGLGRQPMWRKPSLYFSPLPGKDVCVCQSVEPRTGPSEPAKTKEETGRTANGLESSWSPLDKSYLFIKVRFGKLPPLFHSQR